jgi:hypothetical protein
LITGTIDDASTTVAMIARTVASGAIAAAATVLVISLVGLTLLIGGRAPRSLKPLLLGPTDLRVHLLERGTSPLP